MKKENLWFEIVVPIYNEEKELEENITRLRTFLKKEFPQKKWKITIVDNASTDNSLAIAKKLAHSLKELSYIHLTEKGRGRAVKAAWLASNADIVGYTDVDLSTDLDSLLPMLESLGKGFDIAIASRLLQNSHVSNRSMTREIISRLYNILLKFIFQVKFSDAQCGFKIMKKSTFTQLVSVVENMEWFFDTEFLIIAEKVGFRIFEQPVEWRDNPGSTVRVLPTMLEDLNGVWRLFIYKPWRKLQNEKI